jgi:hypothetical protein
LLRDLDSYQGSLGTRKTKLFLGAEKTKPLKPAPLFSIVLQFKPPAFICLALTQELGRASIKALKVICSFLLYRKQPGRASGSAFLFSKSSF